MLTHAHHQTTITPSRGTFVTRLVARLLSADAHYRSMERLRQMPPERLDDLGLTRRHVAEALPHDSRLGW